MKQMKRITAVFICLFAFAMVKANNIQVTNVSTVVTGSVVQIEFDISWENSWRSATTNNWDGAWVFMKFKDGDGTWRHVTFTGSNVVVPSGYTTSFPSGNSDAGVGMFIYRNANGFGNVNLLDVRAGINPVPGTFDIKVIALEMVYIPQGSFYAGDGSVSTNKYSVGNAATPYQVTGSGSTITLGTGATNLKEPFDAAATNTLTGFPTGYPAYWMMKYELSQAGLVQFINSMSLLQQINHFTLAVTDVPGTGIIVYGAGGVRINLITPGNQTTGTPAVVGCDLNQNGIYNEATDGEWYAAGKISWRLAAAYLDWSGLRPMTELEYEKACRGPLAAVQNEFAWGNPDIAAHTYLEQALSSANASMVNLSGTVGNALYYTTNGLGIWTRWARNGMFATAVSTRVSAGAGYYGAMELSGNLLEFCVTTANVAGRSYTGRHGDGKMENGGYANEDRWPGINGNTSTGTANLVYAGNTGVTATAGLILRGGSVMTTATPLRTSNRETPMSGTDGITSIEFGIRGVRDAN